MGDRVRRIALANVALFLAAVVGLVTVDDDEPKGVLVEAAAATVRTGTASFSVHISMRSREQPMEMTATGRVDFDSRNFALTTGTPPSDMISADGVSYLKSEGPKPWMVVDNRPAPRVVPLDFGLVTADPVAALDQLRRGGVARDVRQDGTEDVRGVPTTRWVAHLDTAVISAAGKRNRQFLEAVGIEQMRYSIWVGDDGVLRRISTVAEGTHMSSSVTTELYDFGTAAPVEAPPADQVRRITLPD